MMRVLVACEYSGTVRDAFINTGHDAMSCDILPTDQPGPHYQGDVREMLHERWDLIIAHPPCTYLCNSGVCHLHKDPTRWAKLEGAAKFFKLFLDIDGPRVAIENPIMHKYAKELIGGVNQNQVVQPWMFGHPETKATCLWLKGLPNLQPTNNVKEELTSMHKRDIQRLYYSPPGPERAKIRSKTFQGLADAMAAQWGCLDD